MHRNRDAGSDPAAQTSGLGRLRAWCARRAPHPAPADWRRVVGRRLIVGGILTALWTAGIEARLIYLQVVRHDDLIGRAERQQTGTIEALPKRGAILDREGRMLAYSVDADTIYAVPTEIADPAATVAALCETFGDCSPQERATLVVRLSQRRPFAYVRRQVSPEHAERVAALNLEGVRFLKENRRYYPNKELAAHLLGYVGIDNQGLGGVESTYDADIRGRPGKILIQTDARRRAFSRIERPPTTGATIELTIDTYLQHIAERELRAAVEEHRAVGGTIILMDPHSGEILALANAPTFNPNVFGAFPPSSRRNRAIQEVYEPGSTFKIVTASAALEERILDPQDLIDVSGGVIRFGSRPAIQDVRDFGVLTFTDVLVRSSNVGAIKIGLQLGPERLGRYVRRFGFGQTLSRDFQGESAGIVWNPARLNDSALASVSMGYQVAVTPLQMAAAASAVANGGELLEPRLVRAILRNGVRAEAPRRVLRRAISRETAARLTDIMEGVVDHGTATRAKLAGYRAAGKTGTSEKLIGGRYSSTEHNASFVGFAPSRDPVVTVLVVIDTPRAKGHFGGIVAAPVFKAVAQATLRRLGVPPSLDPASPVLVVRDPRPQPPTPHPARVLAPVGPPATSGSSPGLMPDLTGVSAREAAETLARIGLTTRFLGTGFVVGQHPPPGVAIPRGGQAVVWLERRLMRSPELGTTP